MAEGISKSERALSARLAISQQITLVVVGILADVVDRTIPLRVLEELEDYVDRAESELPPNDPTVVELRRTLDQIRVVFDSS